MSNFKYTDEELEAALSDDNTTANIVPTAQLAQLRQFARFIEAKPSTTKKIECWKVFYIYLKYIRQEGIKEEMSRQWLTKLLPTLGFKVTRHNVRKGVHLYFTWMESEYLHIPPEEYNDAEKICLISYKEYRQRKASWANRTKKAHQTRKKNLKQKEKETQENIQVSTKDSSQE